LAASLIYVVHSNQTKEQQPEEFEEPEIVVNHDPNKTYIYSNCYDGYLNIRSEPSAKSPVVGKVHNGPQGAELIRYQGNWAKVNVGGVIGYIYKNYTQRTPTEPVFVDPDFMIGAWGEDDYHSKDLLIFENGTFAFWDESMDSFTAVGKWYLERYDIILCQSYNMLYDCVEREDTRLRIFVDRRTLGDDYYTKLELISDTKAKKESYGGKIVRWTQPQLNAAQNHIRTFANR
jgi:uncharacterized protein YgiM (DUF1202 family)